jgi:hypothetical protein
MAGNADSQLEIAFFFSNKNRVFYPPLEEVIAWLRICYYSGNYASAFEEVNGRKKYVINPISQKILKEIDQYEHRLGKDGMLKSDALFKELCIHFGIVPSR